MNDRDGPAQKFEQNRPHLRAVACRMPGSQSEAGVAGGVLSGIAALAAGAGPRTASNDLYHRMMLALIGVTFLILFLRKRMLIKMPCS